MKNQKKKAIALSYLPDEDRAPRILTKSSGYSTDLMLDRAISQGIPVHKDPFLTEMLEGLPKGQEIPDNLYRAVATVFALISKTEARAKL